MQDSQRQDCPEGRKFSILGFESTDGAITAGFDPNSGAAEFTLAPKVDVEKLKPGSSGVIEIRLSHPQHRSVSIPYTVLAEFAARPGMIAVSWRGFYSKRVVAAAIRVAGVVFWG